MSKPVQEPYHQPDMQESNLPESAPIESSENQAEDTIKNFASDASVAQEPMEKSPIWKKWYFWVGSISGVLFALLLLLVIYTAIVGQKFYSQTQEIITSSKSAYTAFKEQNLPLAQTEFQLVSDQLAGLKSTYAQLAIYKFIPVARGYYLDGENGLIAAEAGVSSGLKTIAAISPYADVLGFTGEETIEDGNAQNRIKLILETLDKVSPQLDAIEQDLQLASTSIGKINPNRYPKTLKGMEIRSNIVQAQDGLNAATTLLSDYRPIIEKMPEIAGSKGERKKYLVLFQNDNELRPTGGFLTAYAVIFIEDGVVTPEKSDDIYELDKKFNKRIPIPEALGKYLTTEKYWNLRDMNTSPDFLISMEQFFEFYQDIPGEPENIDGIIAVDTHVLTDLIRTVGPIEVAGYGTFSAEDDPRCDCPQIIYALSEIITRPTPYHRVDRKGILAPLMQSILQKIYASPRVFMADLFKVGVESMEGRHLQAYFVEPEFQTAVESIGAAGRLEAVENSDQLAIVNANLGGAKSNLFIDYEVEQVVSAPENGRITKTVEITYKNHRKGDNCNLEAGLLCLNSTLRDWTRLYVPGGSELVEANGFVESPTTYDEAGFTVFDGFFTLEPEGQAKLVITYTVPYQDDQEYRLEMWKQGGIGSVPVLMDVTGGQEEFLLDSDSSYTTPF